METEYSLNAYELNQIIIYAVQGEENSRNLIFNIIEKSGVQIPTSNAAVVNKMLDLTGYTAKLYVVSDKVSSCDGIILDAENGRLSFDISKECCSSAGNFNCAVVLTKSNEDLRIVGITLNVAEINIENSMSINIISGTTCSFNVEIYDNNNEPYILQDNDELIFGVKQQLSDKECILKIESTGNNITVNPSDTKNMNGIYYYDIGLLTATGDYYIVIPTNKLTVKKSVTSKE